MTTHPNLDLGYDKRLHRQMVNLFKALDYNFERFTLPDFVRWLEAQQNDRKIVLVPGRLPASLSGAWLATETCDYIFYAGDALALHQMHIQLHELSHLLCGHAALAVDEDEHLIPEEEAWVPPSVLLLDAHRTPHAELEAELLASLIHMHVLQRESAVEQTDVVHASNQADVLHDLLYLQTWLQTPRPRVELAQPHRWDAPVDLDLQIYRTMIRILDRRRKLVNDLNPMGDSLELSVPLRQARLLDETAVHPAFTGGQAALLQALLTTPQDIEYAELVQRYCQISRQLQQAFRISFLPPAGPPGHVSPPASRPGGREGPPATPLSGHSGSWPRQRGGRKGPGNGLAAWNPCAAHRAWIRIAGFRGG